MVLGGQLPKIKIPRLSVTPGESIIDFIDTLTRHLSQESNITISHSATPEGDFAIVVGKTGVSDAIVEGQNMLEGRELIYIPMVAAPPPGNGGNGGDQKASQATTGQRPGNDDKWGAEGRARSVPVQVVRDDGPKARAERRHSRDPAMGQVDH